MRLVVHVPPGYEPERRYIIAVVFGEWLGLEARMQIEKRDTVAITLEGDDSTRCVTMPDRLFQTPQTDWLKPGSLPKRPLSSVAVPSGFAQIPSRPMPVVFGTPDATVAAERQDLATVLSLDVLGTTFFLLARYEEIALPAADAHGRFGASRSILSAPDQIREPLADRYVELLSEALRLTWPALPDPPSRFRLWLTHDVDQPYAGLGRAVRDVVRSAGADLLVRRDPRFAARRAWAFAGRHRSRAGQDPYDVFNFIMDVSERHDLRSSFFFLAGGDPSDFDFRYRLADPPYRRLVARVHQRGHEVGLHASYVSHGDVERTRREFIALRDVCASIGFEQEVWGIRQHYLRFTVPATWAIQAEAALDYDSSLGFHDAIGFRAGTSHRFTVFDAVRRSHLALIERPLIVMDITLTEYLGLAPADAMERTLSVIAECRRYGGEAVLLFHNNSVVRPYEQRAYQELVEAVCATRR